MSVCPRNEREAGRSSTLLPLSISASLPTLVSGADLTLTDTVSRSELSSDSDSLVYLELVGLVLRLSEEEVSGLQPSILNIMSSLSGLLDDVFIGLRVDLEAGSFLDVLLCFEEDLTRTDLTLELNHHGWVGALCAAWLLQLNLLSFFDFSVFLRVCSFVCLLVRRLVVGRSKS